MCCSLTTNVSFTYLTHPPQLWGAVSSSCVSTFSLDGLLKWVILESPKLPHIVVYRGYYRLCLLQLGDTGQCHFSSITMCRQFMYFVKKLLKLSVYQWHCMAQVTNAGIVFESITSSCWVVKQKHIEMINYLIVKIFHILTLYIADWSKIRSRWSPSCCMFNRDTCNGIFQKVLSDYFNKYWDRIWDHELLFPMSLWCQYLFYFIFFIAYSYGLYHQPN